MGSHRKISITETGSISRRTLVMGAATLIPVGIISLSLYSSALPASSANKVEVKIKDETTTPAAHEPQDKPAVEASLSAGTSARVNGGSLSVEVNGQDIPIPESGSLNQTIPTENGSVKIDVQDNSGGGNEEDGQSSIRVNIDSNTSASGNEDFETETRTRIRIRER